MSRIRRALALLILGISISPNAFTCNNASKSNAMNTINKIRQELIVGMPLQSVEKVFDAHHLGYTFVLKDQIQQFDIPARPASYYASLKGSVLSIIRGDKSKSGIAKDFSIRVDIDENDKVLSVAIESIYTGP